MMSSAAAPLLVLFAACRDNCAALAATSHEDLFDLQVNPQWGKQPARDLQESRNWNQHMFELEDHNDPNRAELGQKKHNKFETFVPDVMMPSDVCRNGTESGWEKCDESKFETCADDFFLCYYRQIDESNRLYHDQQRIHPRYYIDYSAMQCVPQFNEETQRFWNCDRCDDDGRICWSLGYCMTEDNWTCYCPDKAKKRVNRYKDCPADVREKMEKIEAGEKAELTAAELRRKRREERLGLGGGTASTPTPTEQTSPPDEEDTVTIDVDEAERLAEKRRKRRERRAERERLRKERLRKARRRRERAARNAARNRNNRNRNGN